MAFKYTGDATLGVALTVETPKPLDNRTVVNNLDELYSIPEKYAYQGMTVSNIDNGNIYMLIDKSKIKLKDGWKASYESILIITCTEDEYKEWASNTTEDFKPIDTNKTYLHAETYYYIYEDSMNDDLFYLSAEWGKKIEELLNLKAMQSTVSLIKKDLDLTINNLSNYATLEELTSKYTPKTDLDLEDPNSFISQTLSSYYTKAESDDIFVTKESLRGEGIEGDNFVFVTQDKYQLDLLTIREELDKAIKTDGNGTLESIAVGQIKSPVQEDLLLVINVTKDGLYNGDNKYALESLIPNLVTLPEEEYLLKVEDGTLELDTYYYVYDATDNSKVYITKEYLDLNYHSITLYLFWISSRFYTKVLIDEIISLLEQSGDYVTTLDILAYYTSELIENRFSTKEEVESTYATKELIQLYYTKAEVNKLILDAVADLLKLIDEMKNSSVWLNL